MVLRFACFSYTLLSPFTLYAYLKSLISKSNTITTKIWAGPAHAILLPLGLWTLYFIEFWSVQQEPYKAFLILMYLSYLSYKFYQMYSNLVSLRRVFIGYMYKVEIILHYTTTTAYYWYKDDELTLYYVIIDGVNLYS